MKSRRHPRLVQHMTRAREQPMEATTLTVKLHLQIKWRLLDTTLSRYSSFNSSAPNNNNHNVFIQYQLFLYVQNRNENNIRCVLEIKKFQTRLLHVYYIYAPHMVRGKLRMCAQHQKLSWGRKPLYFVCVKDFKSYDKNVCTLILI